jgi:2-hydroxychromene-2-carboxylate isomerase
VIAVAQSGADVETYLPFVFRAAWAEQQDGADREVLAAILDRNGLDAAGLLPAAESAPVIAQYEKNLEEAIAAGVFGSPTYVLEGENFWGQDRLDLLEEALASRRKPYTPNV